MLPVFYHRLSCLWLLCLGAGLLACDKVPSPVAGQRGGQAGSDRGQRIGSMWISYYYLAREADVSGAPQVALLDSACKPIATVSRAFYDAVCVEGSGRLRDGRLVNFARRCPCAAPCAYNESRICYSELDARRYPWGKGSGGRALVPLRSWAVDSGRIPIGTLLYAAEWDGIEIPALDGLGGFSHDGCFRADDVGGAVKDDHFDLFAGSRAMVQRLNAGRTATRRTFTVYKNPDRCNHLK
jgi:3D (Asp-Asp-Asp) domain-containing protein